jgi:hypothetical protein
MYVMSITLVIIAAAAMWMQTKQKHESFLSEEDYAKKVDWLKKEPCSSLRMTHPDGGADCIAEMHSTGRLLQMRGGRGDRCYLDDDDNGLRDPVLKNISCDGLFGQLKNNMVTGQGRLEMHDAAFTLKSQKCVFDVDRSAITDDRTRELNNLLKIYSNHTCGANPKHYLKITTSSGDYIYYADVAGWYKFGVSNEVEFLPAFPELVTVREIQIFTPDTYVEWKGGGVATPGLLLDGEDGISVDGIAVYDHITWLKNKLRALVEAGQALQTRVDAATRVREELADKLQTNREMDTSYEYTFKSLNERRQEWVREGGLGAASGSNYDAEAEAEAEAEDL